MKNSSLLNWLLWWRIPEADIEAQVRGYDILSVWRSARGLSMVLLLAAALVMSLVIFFGGWDAIGYIDVGVLGILAVLIYEGHRWAMLAAMIVWTVEKLLSILWPGNAAMILVALIWWAAYMRVLWLAFQTETRRMARAPV